MSYNPDIKVFYTQGSGVVSESNRLVPAPQISLVPEFYYANDTVIGYTYNITLNGYATSIDLRIYDGTEEPNFDDTIEAIQDIKNIFNGNNGTLHVLSGSGMVGQPVFKATGGIVRDITFEPSDNLWFNYSRYTIQLEFNEIQLADCVSSGVAVVCGQLPEKIPESPELIDMRQYKVKNFNDNWSFDLNENVYNSYNLKSSKFRNEHFNISYTINATGKHYFVNNRLLPAWEQAKNFCQYRLKQQVDRLIDKTLRRTNSDDGCITDGTLSTIFRTGTPGLLDNLSNSLYDIYNEKISCDSSEADGSFSLTYNAILKRKVEGDTFSDPNSIHTFNVSKTISDDGNNRNITISVDGSIQGLIKGGLIKSSGILSLPSTGDIIVTSSPSGSKYDNSLIAYNKIGTSSELKSGFANLLDITNSALEASGNCISPLGIPPVASHQVNHNYTQGIITYNTSYDTNRACLRDSSYRIINLSVQEPIPIIAEFIIPGRSGGPIIQDLGVETPKRITISIDGAVNSSDCCPDVATQVYNACYFGTPSITGIPSAEIAGMKLIQDTTNIGSDGSYSINRAYICCDI